MSGPLRDVSELSDVTVPFSGLRSIDIPASLPITRYVLDVMATAEENPRFSEVDRTTFIVSALFWALRDVERQLVALRAAHGGRC